MKTRAKARMKAAVKRALQKLAFGKAALLKAKGFPSRFLDEGREIPLLHLSADQRKELPRVEGNPDGILHYLNFSVVYHRRRRIPFYVVYAIDGLARRSVERAGGFRLDPRLDKNLQLDGRFYDLEKRFTEFEIGHMAANNEMAWGDQAQVQSYQTFHFPNSVPQAERLNSGLWQQLEKYVIQETGEVDGKRICVFTGPVMKEEDPPYLREPSFRMPLAFFKVILYRRNGGIRAVGFMMSHKRRLIEEGIIAEPPAPRTRSATPGGPFEDYPHREVFQVDIDLIERESGISFQFDQVKRITVPGGQNRLNKIEAVSGSEGVPRGVRSRSVESTDPGRLNVIL
ncbi:MAG: DNA/RNA non-specific endonuclease [Verrucomicrobiota bacterium]